MSTRLQIVVSEEEARRYKKAARRTHLSLSEWVRRSLRRALQAQKGPWPQQKLAALERALQHHYPTADVDQMLAEIEQGRGLR